MIRRTVRIHKSGRRLNLSAMVVVGNKNGYIGVGIGRAATNKEAIQKAARKARMNIFPIRRGCGSAECRCGEEHSIPFISFGKTGSVLVKLMPAPKGLKLCSPEEIKKMFRLAGIKDIRIKSRQINKCLKQKSKKRAGNYQWFYYDENSPQKISKWIDPNLKSVLQFTKNGDFIKESV